jgi:hypothetical protein
LHCIEYAHDGTANFDHSSRDQLMQNAREVLVGEIEMRRDHAFARRKPDRVSVRAGLPELVEQVRDDALRSAMQRAAFEIVDEAVESLRKARDDSR